MTSLETETLETEINPPSSETDTGWKSVLDAYFPQLLAFFYPPLHKKIDWTQHYQFLDKELQLPCSRLWTGCSRCLRL